MEYRPCRFHDGRKCKVDIYVTVSKLVNTQVICGDKYFYDLEVDLELLEN